MFHDGVNPSTRLVEVISDLQSESHGVADLRWSAASESKILGHRILQGEEETMLPAVYEFHHGSRLLYEISEQTC